MNQEEEKLDLIDMPDSNKVVNIEMVKDESKNRIVKSDDSYYELPYYKTEFFTESDFTKFIKECEKLIRRSDSYSDYIYYLKAIVGLRSCAVLGNVEDGEKEMLIEMHHGPILTLYDYCAIVTEAYLTRKKKVNTFIIADAVLKLHYENKVQIVPLSQTVHELVHAGKIYIHPSQAWGDLNAFLEEYEDGINDDQRYIINKNIEIANKNASSIADCLKLTEIKQWMKKDTVPLTEGDLEND